MKIIFTCLATTVLYSCATSSLHSDAKKEPAQPYRNVLTLYVEEPLTLHQFDSAFFTDNVRNKFNNLGTLPLRRQLEKTLKRNLSNTSTRVISSSELFGVNDEVNYSIFKQKIESANVDAILLINEDQYWETVSYNRVGNTLETESQPNSAFHCYFADAATGEVLWLARCTVRGIFAGYDTLNNMLARRVSRILKNEGYIQGE
jgi:hypothetical protein